MEFDWGKCIICQKDTNEYLRCFPCTRYDWLIQQTCIKFLDNVQQFRAVDALPVELYFTADESAASWQKRFHLKFNKRKLERARKAEKRSHSPDIKERRLKTSGI